MPEITCYVCGRTGRTSTAPPPGQVAVCQRCATDKLRETASGVSHVAPDDTNLKTIREYDGRIFVGQPWDPTQYSPELYLMWLEVEAESERRGVNAGTIYSGSIRRRCMGCGIVIAIGPNQQETLALLYREKVEYRVMCHLCAMRTAKDEGASSMAVMGLEDPVQGRD